MTGAVAGASTQASPIGRPAGNFTLDLPSRAGRRWSRRTGRAAAWGWPRRGVACTDAAVRRTRRLCSRSRRSRPAFMTATRSQTCRTTDRSCETNTSVRSSSSTRSEIRLSTWARTDTSSALTGSSATRMRGRRRERPGDGDALALTAGELVRVAVRRRPRTGRRPRAARRRAGPRRRMALDDERFGDDVADPHPGVERAHRVLEDHLQRSAQERAAAARAAGRCRCPRHRTSPDVGSVEPGEDPQQRGLAAAGLADDAEPLARVTSRLTPRSAWTTGAGRRSEVRGRG